MHNESKPEMEQGHPEKPNNHSNGENGVGCLESFLGVFKNLFGCIKNAEEAYSHAPPGLSDQLQQVQVPQQVRSQFSVPFLRRQRFRIEWVIRRVLIMDECRLLNRPLLRKTSKYKRTSICRTSSPSERIADNQHEVLFCWKLRFWFLVVFWRRILRRFYWQEEATVFRKTCWEREIKPKNCLPTCALAWDMMGDLDGSKCCRRGGVGRNKQHVERSKLSLEIWNLYAFLLHRVKFVWKWQSHFDTHLHLSNEM
jgi:hypothetical protein